MRPNLVSVPSIGIARVEFRFWYTHSHCHVPRTQVSGIEVHGWAHQRCCPTAGFFCFVHLQFDNNDLSPITVLAMKFAMWCLFTTLLGASNARSLNFTELEQELQRDILKRACVDTPCTCQGITLAVLNASPNNPKNLFCGDGAFNCQKGHVFQCGSVTNVCDYGARISCGGCTEIFC
ncbi:hypothetical protein BKA62DRAFT_486017 [Auriculariales sp. MPI-PUGE-AT-0066]|nr:hypothetical protein BKA62DRAFT_486017 [Auriculariales sp. MPI-PUGE-AT-0066]